MECRICQDEDEDFKMETPCSCFGSLKYAHRRCMQKWGNWVISRRDLHNPKFIAMVSTDCNFLDPNYDEYSIHTTRSLLCCRTAVIENSLPPVKLLIEASADLNVGTCGVVPIVVAATQVETEMIKCLLKAGADPNVYNHEGFTPLKIAALESEKVMEKRKVKAKENFNEAKSQGETAFRKKKYLLATKWYSMATTHGPDDANVYSNRSLCYALLKEEVALADTNA
ncbi:hypothetical protein IFM89_020669 [Coptis chinensis]|uniref:RING-CH-type domain-containing protein n=1 Tax=Coptis chinensis TaxID=261450 RepID=A0A835GX81_9MAGN|nr:hypothetical protein IFM89_020669 [Coptis chinensis]